MAVKILYAPSQRGYFLSRAVLVAISIPVFTGQLAKARESTYAANMRAAYASASVDLLEDDSLDITSYQYSGNTYNVSASGGAITVSATIGGTNYSFDGNTWTGFTSITPGN